MITIHDQSRFQLLPQVVLFDLDNTFYAYDPAHAAAYKAVCAKVTNTFSIPHATVTAAYEHARIQVKQKLHQTGASHNRLLYMQAMLEHIGLGSQILLSLDLEQTYWRTFLSHAVLFNHVKELLDDLRLSNISTAVVTDLTTQIQFRKLVYFGLDSYFDFIVTSEETGHDKPHASMYQTVLRKLNYQGSQVWMIGDNPINDIWGARTVIQAITLQKVHDGVHAGKEDQRADAIFSDFNDVRKLLAIIDKR
jgi:putative hydrolase of the HAD superfamily